MFKWYWLYKKECNKKKMLTKTYHSYILFISRNSSSKKINLLPFKFFLWQCPLENVIKPLVSHFQFIFPNSTDPEILATYQNMDILINGYFQ